MEYLPREWALLVTRRLFLSRGEGGFVCRHGATAQQERRIFGFRVDGAGCSGWRDLG